MKQPGPDAAFERLERAILAFLCLGAVGWFAWNGVRILVDPYLLGYTEGINLLAGHGVLAGVPLYTPINRPPYFYYAYPPLHAWLAAVLIALSGKGLAALRALTLVCEVALAALAGRIVRRATDEPWIGRVCACLLLGLFAVHKFHALARVDFLQLALVLAAVEQLLAYRNKPACWRLVAMGLFLVLACLAKQTSLLPLGVSALVAVAGLRRRPRESARLLASLAGSVVVVVGVFWIEDRAVMGEMFRQIVVYQARLGIDRRGGVELARMFLRLYWPVVCAGGVGLLAIRGEGALKSFLLVSLGWGLLSTFRAGADLNYGLEPLVWLVIAWGVALGSSRGRLAPWLRDIPNPLADSMPDSMPHSILATMPGQYGVLRTRRVMRVAALTLATTAAGYFLTVPHSLEGIYLGAALNARDERAALNRLMSESEGLTLSEEPFFAVANGKPFWLSDPFALGVLARRGEFDPRPIVDACARGRVTRMLVGPRLASLPGIRAVLAWHYRQIYEGGITDEGTPWAVYDWKQ